MAVVTHPDAKVVAAQGGLDLLDVQVELVGPHADRIRHVERIGVVFGQRTQLWWDLPVIDGFDLLRDIYMAVIALAIGVPPGQYVLLVSVSRALQSLQHANVRIHFGKVGEWLLVSPRFHRTHHAIGLGHESRGQGTLGGCNFGVLLPVWDILFRTANFTPRFEATGVRDQLPRQDASGATIPGRNYGRGFWQQQWLGLKRMVEYLRGGAT